MEDVERSQAAPGKNVKYQIEQIKEMGSADEQSRQITERDHTVSILKPSRTSDDEGNLIANYNSFTASPR